MLSGATTFLARFFEKRLEKDMCFLRFFSHVLFLCFSQKEHFKKNVHILVAAFSA
jgi:hypothetical protein